MSEEEAILEMMQMTDEELLLVDFTVVKWVCSGKGCCRGTKVRDYGIAPVYFHPRKSIRWINVDENYWMCEKHYLFTKRLIKNFPKRAIEQKLFDFEKTKIIAL